MVFRNATSEFQIPPAAGVIAASREKDEVDDLKGILLPLSWRLRTAQTNQDVLALLHREISPVVLSDAELPDGGWRNLLDALAAFPAPPRLIVCSRTADERLWAEVLNLGAYDLLLQPFDRGEVTRVIELAYSDWCRASRKEVIPEGVSDAPDARNQARAAGH